jgi:hypothetical protein
LLRPARLNVIFILTGAMQRWLKNTVARPPPPLELVLAALFIAVTHATEYQRSWCWGCCQWCQLGGAISEAVLLVVVPILGFVPELSLALALALEELVASANLS